MITVTQHKITSRPFQDEQDFWRVRSLLIETYPMTPLGFNWEIRRWDGWRFHHEKSTVKADWHDAIRLWETEEGKLVGAAHPEGRGDLFLEVHPDYREIEEDMIAWGEENLDVYRDQQRQLETFVFDGDTLRHDLLLKRGYEATSSGGVGRRMRLEGRDLPHVTVAEGYGLSSTRSDERDFERAAALLNVAFKRTIHTAREYRTFATQSPSFRHLLNLVAEAPDGTFAAHVGVTYDSANRLAIFEPVCTHPDHRRKGLASALMLEGQHRAKALGALEAVVGTGDDPGVNHLYESVGFTEVAHGLIWRKVW